MLKFKEPKVVYSKGGTMVLKLKGLYQRNFCTQGTTPILSFNSILVGDLPSELQGYIGSAQRVQEIKLRNVWTHADAIPTGGVCEITTEGPRRYSAKISVSQEPFMSIQKVFLLDLAPKIAFPNPIENEVILLFLEWDGREWSYRYVRVGGV